MTRSAPPRFPRVFPCPAPMPPQLAPHAKPSEYSILCALFAGQHHMTQLRLCSLRSEFGRCVSFLPTKGLLQLAQRGCLTGPLATWKVRCPRLAHRRCKAREGSRRYKEDWWRMGQTSTSRTNDAKLSCTPLAGAARLPQDDGHDRPPPTQPKWVCLRGAHGLFSIRGRGGRGIGEQDWPQRLPIPEQCSGKLLDPYRVEVVVPVHPNVGAFHTRQMALETQAGDDPKWAQTLCPTLAVSCCAEHAAAPHQQSRNWPPPTVTAMPPSTTAAPDAGEA